MDYHFKTDLTGRYLCDMSMEHGLFGRWLMDEVANNPITIHQVCSLIKKAQSKRIECLALHKLGAEVTLYLDSDEAVVKVNQGEGFEPDLLPDNELYLDDLSVRAGCGFDDFVNLFYAWCDFVKVQCDAP
ncbi:hypothetical protein C2869_16600 [Saccharobesus litoralis]|uniref:Uncharacterized protein n=1 Tax=Saccharobesus litoralis TaxID=2172099 RepID=A0A2S0VUU9_9ALTE|nr:YacL family protein [Saccharobesus litoralis]AWB67942.1 hypothetical protein C2869_16600 [Saccharobesus litoralis]